jgi:hypothetical protein
MAKDSFFDDLARGLADGSITRGKALKLMGAAVVGGTLGSLGVGGVAVADEECKPTGKKCRKNAQCCSGKCEGNICVAACPSGQVMCGGSCVSNSCLTGQTFNTTTCQCECPSGQEVCSGCGTCVSNEPGAGNRSCICKTLPGGTGQICYYGSVSSFDSCAACAAYPGSVCVEPTNGTFACVYPCVNGAPCGGGL